MSKRRRQYRPEFKAKVAPAAIKNEETTAELAARFQVHPTMINNWKNALLEGAADLLDKGQKAKKNHETAIDELYTNFPRPRTSTPHPEHRIYPYLLRDLDIDRPDMVWASDITYVPIRRGFMYLVAVMDWHSRKVLSWRLSNTLDLDFYLSALEEAIARYGRPDILNTDQSCQFTSKAFTDIFKTNGIKISMDGRGRFLDNIFIERLWWTVKYDYLHLNSFKNGLEMRKNLRKWFIFYNRERTHQSLNRQTPDECYFKEQRMAA